MSTLYVGNATPQNVTLTYRLPLSRLPDLLQSCGPSTVRIPAGGVSQIVDTPANITSVVAQWTVYGIGAWSGSGIGYSIDTPITM